MTMAIQLLILALLLLAVPTVIGGLSVSVDRAGENLLFRWISGQFLLWAGFQAICVPMILTRQSLTRTAWVFSGYMAVLCLLALAAGMWRRRKGGNPFRLHLQGEGSGKGRSLLLWAVFWGLCLFQLVQAVRLVYEDSDDAYYVAVASIAERSDTMYQVLPYTGGTTQLDARHGLAPFSIWIAFLARLSGMQTVAVAQTVLPVVLIGMAYGIYYLFSVVLFPEGGGQRPLFLIFAEILVMFGDYSVYTAETFLIGRSRQGKASLGSIVFPFLLLLSLMLFRKLQKKERISPGHYLLLGAAAAAGCLCSTLGALLICILLGIAGLLAAICYKKPKVTAMLAACCAPCLVYALLYLVLD